MRVRRVNFAKFWNSQDLCDVPINCAITEIEKQDKTL